MRIIDMSDIKVEKLKTYAETPSIEIDSMKGIGPFRANKSISSVH